jgi:hypothetical protein
MAQSKPRIRDNHAGRHFSQIDPVYWLAQRTVRTLLLLPARTIYRGTAKQYSFVRVQKDYRHSIAEKKGTAK